MTPTSFLKETCKSLAFHLLCLHWAASAYASFIRVRVRFFSTVHRLYMASALTRYFVKDADADQCKGTFTRTGQEDVLLVIQILTCKWIRMCVFLSLYCRQSSATKICYVSIAWLTIMFVE